MSVKSLVIRGISSASCPFTGLESSQENQKPEVFCQKDVVRNFPKFTGKHFYQSLACRIQLVKCNTSETGT